MRLYAGVGVVAAADAVAEWRELNLKTTPLESLVAARDGTSRSLTQTKLGSLGSLAMAPNAARPPDVLIGELFRDGVRVFCVAPARGARRWRSPPSGTPPRASSCAWTKRGSLAFYELGVGKGAGAGGGAAVITSSGTAVATCCRRRWRRGEQLGRSCCSPRTGRPS